MPNGSQSRKRAPYQAHADDQPSLNEDADPLTKQLQRSSQARLAGILAIADDAIISVVNQQRIRLFNQGVEKIFGYTARAALGQPIELLLPQRFEDIHQQHLAAFARSPETAPRMSERRDIYGWRKDGTELAAAAASSQLELAGGATLTVILRDITARKRADQSVQKPNLAVERANQAKAHCLANMSYELRTPARAGSGLGLYLRHLSLGRCCRTGRFGGRMPAKIHFFAPPCGAAPRIVTRRKILGR